MDDTAVKVDPAAVREASMRLPERQREALALREREHLSYEEIGAAMGIGSGSVAQLISRARINLYDELRGTALASIAAPSPECERALPLIAAREDGQLESSTDDATWLDAHLAGCDRCSLAAEQMHEADVSYRTWVPPGRAEAGSSSGTAAAEAPPPGRGRRPRRRATLAAALAVLLLLTVLAAAALIGDAGAPAPADPAAGAASKQSHATRGGRASGGKGGTAKQQTRSKAKAPASAAQNAGKTTPAIVAIPEQEAADGGNQSAPASDPQHSSGKAAIQPTHQTTASKPSAKPKPAPASTPSSQPASEPASAPEAESPPPAEETSEKPGHSGEPHGKPPNQPKH
jgi:predicted DNA-binding protein (UPF0251 family)